MYTTIFGAVENGTTVISSVNVLPHSRKGCLSFDTFTHLYKTTKPHDFQTMLDCYDKHGASGLWASSDPDSTTDITREQNHSHCPVHTEFCHCAAEDGISHNPITEDSILPHLAMPDRVRAFMAPHEYHFFTRRACDPSWSLDEASRRHCHIIPRFK
jgi:hypothetical protein